MKNLAARTTIGMAQLLGGIGILLFAPAWTFNFWQAWLFLMVFGASVLLITAYLWKNDRLLLERRMKAGPRAEKTRSQNVIQSLAALVFMGVIALSSIDHHFSWSNVAVWLVILGDALVVLGFFVTFVVFKANSFAAGTIEVEAEQKIVSTGPYAIVRHPMYFGSLFMFAGIPLAIGSWWGLTMIFPITLILAWRMIDEERFLSANLSGYEEYRRRVRYRLVPFVW